MSDDLKEILYGKTIKMKLADGKDYTFREPDLDTLSSLTQEDLSNAKKMAWIMMRYDNPGLTEAMVGRLITASMFESVTRAIAKLMGREEDGKNV